MVLFVAGCRLLGTSTALILFAEVFYTLGGAWIWICEFPRWCLESWKSESPGFRDFPTFICCAPSFINWRLHISQTSSNHILWFCWHRDHSAIMQWYSYKTQTIGPTHNCESQVTPLHVLPSFIIVDRYIIFYCLGGQLDQIWSFRAAFIHLRWELLAPLCNADIIIFCARLSQLRLQMV